jgi:hypothetical protein
MPEGQLPSAFSNRPSAPIPESPPDTPVAISRSLSLPEEDDVDVYDRSPSPMPSRDLDAYQHPPSRLAVRDDMPSDVSSRASTASSIFSNITGDTSVSSDTPVPRSPTLSITPSMLTTSSYATAPRSPLSETHSNYPTPPSSHITVKVAHQDSIIMVRVARDAAIDDVRKKVKDKFSAHESIELSEGFTLAIALPSPLKPLILGGRARSNSLSTLGSVQMKIVVSQADWDKAVDNMEGPKMALRVLDTFA